MRLGARFDFWEFASSGRKIGILRAINHYKNEHLQDFESDPIESDHQNMDQILN